MQGGKVVDLAILPENRVMSRKPPAVAEGAADKAKK
jgi:hypothetical protein